jgi:hypothetical protein
MRKFRGRRMLNSLAMLAVESNHVVGLENYEVDAGRAAVPGARPN